MLLKFKYFEIEYGDITASFPYSEFVLNNKTLQGVRLGVNYEGFEYTGVYSIPKGKSKQEDFYGDGTQGPYRLNTGGFIILEDTEEIKIDGAIQKRS